MQAAARRLRLSNMPGVVDWLIELRDNGPTKRHEGRSGASARSYGLTDYWVKHKGTGHWMFLESLKRKEAKNPRWYELVDYGEGLEQITPYGRKVLETYLQSSTE